MSKELDRLLSAIGSEVRSVNVELLFYGAEPKGDVGNVSIRFADESQVFLGCAGDGGIFVARSTARTGNPPGFTTQEYSIPGLTGALDEVLPIENSLKLTIGGRAVLLTNTDDELSLSIDGVGLFHEGATREKPR